MARSNTLKKQYTSQRRRIQRFIKNAEKRGFSFTSKETILPKIPKKITKASINRLKKITSDTLYRKATYLTDEGVVVSGWKGRFIERSNASKKAAKTRKLKRQSLTKEKISKQPTQIPMPDVSPEWLEHRRRQDELDRKRLSESDELRQMFSEGNMIYEQIKQSIAEVRRDHLQAGMHLERVLNNHITQYGKEIVIRTIAQAPSEVLELIDISLRYNPGDNRHDTAIRELQMLITGYIPDAQEARDLQDAIDQDDYYDEY